MNRIIHGFNAGVQQALADYPRRMGIGELFALGIGHVETLGKSIDNPKEWLEAFSFGYQTYWEALTQYTESHGVSLGQ